MEELKWIESIDKDLPGEFKGKDPQFNSEQKHSVELSFYVWVAIFIKQFEQLPSPQTNEGSARARER